MKKKFYKLFIALFCLCFFAPMYARTDSFPKPVIGILMNEGTTDYSIYPSYAIRKNYGQVITELGGIPIYLGHDNIPPNEYLGVIDGLLLTGGDFDLPSEVYTRGLQDLPDSKKYPRAAIELKLIQFAHKQNIPVLGICAGLQEMNVALGGTLSDDISKQQGGKIQHRHEDRTKIIHFVHLRPGSALYKFIGPASFGVNSNHREGIARLAPSLQINAQAEDGAIEAVNDPSKDFFVGVMWHPEFRLSSQDKALWVAFIQAAKSH